MLMKRSLSLILCTALLLCTWMSSAPTVFGAYTFKTADVRTVLGSVIGNATLSPVLAAVGDRDGDGDIDTTDARVILHMIVDGEATVEEPQTDTFRLSSLSDVTDTNGQRTYRVYAPYSDTYSLTSTGTTAVTLSQNGNTLASGTTLSVALTENAEYDLTVTTAGASAAFTVTVVAQNHRVTLPYDVATPTDTTNISLNSTVQNPLTPAEVNYQKREGGTYIYSNNPELIPQDSIGDAFIRTEDLTGEVYFTFEHANYAGTPLYLGYQLKNEGTEDVYVTVLNVGYQAGGTWFGQLAWFDFYNTAFTLPSDYFTSTGAISSKYSGLDYAYQNYTPRVYQPTTYRLPAGEYFYVIGGTTADAYRGINVDNTANKPLQNQRCANGNVKFAVTGGAVTATFYAYTNAAQVQAEPSQTGYRTGAYAGQYVGTADHSGVIDNYITWTFNDNIGAGMLPVSYTNYYDSAVPNKTAPYAAYNSTAHTTARATSWMTHLNPQNDNRAVGMDLVEFTCVDEHGNHVVIDNHHADGAGDRANTANWMIEYQDHFTLVNQGNKARTVTLHLKDHGTLAVLMRDSVTGEVLETAYTAGLAESGNTYSYDVVIPAHSIKQVTLDYLLVACSYGSVTHSASIS